MDYNGALYKIGELASLANVSKRTIDYYTKLGLLKAERSDSNYRYYDSSALEDLKLIDHYKKLNYSLDMIKERLELHRKKTTAEEELILKQAKTIAEHMELLEGEIKEIHDLLGKLDDQCKKKIASQLTSQTMALLQTLIMFLG
jgi:DNA-binding transcriptional MerR regulator